MSRKVIKIGSSAGVTIPKKQLEELGLQIGDEVDVVFGKPGMLEQEVDYIKTFNKLMKEYGPDLKNLAKR